VRRDSRPGAAHHRVRSPAKPSPERAGRALMRSRRSVRSVAFSGRLSSRGRGIGRDPRSGQLSTDSEDDVSRLGLPVGTRKSTHFSNKITSLGHGFNKFFCHHLPQSARRVSNLLNSVWRRRRRKRPPKGFCSEVAAARRFADVLDPRGGRQAVRGSASGFCRPKLQRHRVLARCHQVNERTVTVSQ
jgi:hypothetical protein